MKRVLFFVAFLIITAGAQNVPNNQADTSGACSPVFQSNQGKIQFTCNTAISEATQKKILTLLNSILKNTSDANATNKKLDSILEYVTHLQPAINQGSGSIAQIGGTGNSATVINTG